MTRDYSALGAAFSKPAPLPPGRLARLGWGPVFSQQISAEALAETPPARVTEVQRSTMRLMGDTLDEIVPSAPDVTVGDWVLLDRALPHESRVLERKSLLSRRAAGEERREQRIAANVDTAFAVTSCNQDFNIARLERYVALILSAGITPVILVTKADQVADADAFAARARGVARGVDVLTLDARGEAARAALAPWCGVGQTIAFLGSSGVGKSTLTNALLESEAEATQAIREDDARGRHTTTTRRLHLAKAGFSVVDMPGMRELGLLDTSDGLREVFADIEDLAAGCKFRNCAHDSEPGCAVQAAVASGDVDQARLERWRKLVAEDAHNAASVAQRRAGDKAFGKMVKRALSDKARLDRGED